MLFLITNVKAAAGHEADGDVSLRLLGGRGASATSHASWGGVEERNGVGVHARLELGER